jgi:glutathione S-transferase
LIKLYFAPRTRSVRIAWLLEELEVPYEIIRRPFVPPSQRFFAQNTPTGKFPTIEDGDTVICESGAIVEYILERHGDGRLAPPIGSSRRGEFLQWLHFAESTAFPPLGIMVWLTLYRDDSSKYADLLADVAARARSGLAFVEERLGRDGYLLGEEFSGADVMLGFTLVAASLLGVLDATLPKTSAYLARLQGRAAFRKAAALE